jgi:hypothetical protein
MARPPDGLKHVDRLPGPESRKRRLRVILATLAGELPIAEACMRLGIGEARFHQLRRRVLAGAMAALGERPAGRPRKREEAAPGRLEALERENEQLRLELHTAEIREEIALVMPHLMRPEKKQITRSRQKRKRPRKTS